MEADMDIDSEGAQPTIHSPSQRLDNAILSSNIEKTQLASQPSTLHDLTTEGNTYPSDFITKSCKGLIPMVAWQGVKQKQKEGWVKPCEVEFRTMTCFPCSVVKLVMADKRKSKRRKINNSKGMITVRAYQKQSNQFYIAEAAMELDSSGNLDTKYIAYILHLSGRLHVSKVAGSQKQMLTHPSDYLPQKSLCI